MAERINTNPHMEHFVLKRNKNFPNSKLPVLVYRAALKLPDQKKRAAVITQKILARNGWSNSWSNGIYDFHHYHSTTHECLVICAGKATVILGGPKGKKIEIVKGDVLILAAGHGHKCLKYTADFSCVGSYPQGKDYDINTGKLSEYKNAVKTIKQLSLPQNDPVFGKAGFLKMHWKK